MGQNGSAPRGQDEFNRNRPSRHARPTLRSRARNRRNMVQAAESSSTGNPARRSLLPSRSNIPQARPFSFHDQGPPTTLAPSGLNSSSRDGWEHNRGSFVGEEEQGQMREAESTEHGNRTGVDTTVPPLPRQSRLSYFGSTISRRLSTSRPFPSDPVGGDPSTINSHHSSNAIESTLPRRRGTLSRSRRQSSYLPITTGPTRDFDEDPNTLIPQPNPLQSRMRSPVARNQHLPNSDSSSGDDIDTSTIFAQYGDPSTHATSRMSRVRHSVSMPIDFLTTLQRSWTRRNSLARSSTSPMPPFARAHGMPSSVVDDSHATRLEHFEANGGSEGSMEPSEISRSPFESDDLAISQTEDSISLGRSSQGGLTQRSDFQGATDAPTARSDSTSQSNQDESLPHVLSLAALAVASRLNGTSDGDPHNLRPALNLTDLERSIQNLSRILQGTAQAQSPGESAQRSSDGRRRSASDQPFNFLRVFRVASNVPNTDTSLEAPSVENFNDLLREDSGNLQDGSVQTETTENRTVAVVVVGVRSVPFNQLAHEEGILTSLTNQHHLELASRTANGGLSDRRRSGVIRRAMGRSRNAQRQQHLNGESDPFQHGYSRQHPSQDAIHALRGSYDLSSTSNSDGRFAPASMTYDETPQGPSPPPSTPAYSSMSPYSSGDSTPVRRPNSASAIQNMPVIQEPTTRHSQLTSDPVAAGWSETHVRQRRRSDSEFARHRDLGAGAARRNGVIGPDDAETLNPTGTRSRSWLVYVVGTNVSEDHPALSAPSLFSDNPSYEDMLLLSSLLGPVKPPVASRDDVEKAKGTFIVRGGPHDLVAYEISGIENISIGSEEHCLICLETYQVDEELRKLAKCSHVFHRSCVDEWLTTGRNSCPLCRSQGVDEASSA